MRRLQYALLLGAVLLVSACSDVLDVEPSGKIPAEDVLSTPEGIEAQMANLYGRLPVEDFNYSPNKGFDIGVGTDLNNSGFVSAHYCDEALHSEYNDFGEEVFGYWNDGYKLVRDLNSLLATVPALERLTQEEKDRLSAETYFLRAYTYFALARRYGGVPYLRQAQDYDEETEKLKIPRSTEKETWDNIIADCDSAVVLFGDTYEKGPRRADKWVALALKSRVALFAASIAKFSHQPNVSFSGPAVEQKLVGIDAACADAYYGQCLEACGELMNSGKFGLYKPSPATPEEAEANYQELFEHPEQHLDGIREPLFIKSYAKNTLLAHNADIWFSPRQIITDPNLFPGRMDPTLDFVDSFEDYTDDGTGTPKPLLTREDGNESDYNGFALDTKYIVYPLDKPSEIAAGRDARLRAMVLFPGEYWRDVRIVIQGGLVKADGSDFHYRTQATETGPDGKVYYTYGAATPTGYSGFDPSQGNYTRSGFLFKKFLQIQNPVELGWEKCTQAWIDFRYAEILLNYAEAAIEKSDATADERQKGKEALNSIRHRAAHTDDIELTTANVRKERFVELAFENKRRWDLVRWRTYHVEFQNRIRKGLVPFLDLRTNPPHYLFVRVNPMGIEPKTFDYTWYYATIPEISSNGLVQNP